MPIRSRHRSSRRGVSPRAGVCALGAALVWAAAGGCETPGAERPPITVEQRAAGFTLPESDLNRLGYRLDWRAFPPVERGGGIDLFTPTPTGILALESGSSLTLLEPATGAIRWSTELSNPLTKFVGVGMIGDAAAAASENEIFFVSANTGGLVDRQRIEKVVNTAPALFGDLAIFGTTAGELMAHSVSQALRAWGFASPGAIEQPPVMIGSAVGAVTQAGHVVFLDAGTGALLGRNLIFGGLSTEPVVGGGLMFVASLDQSLYAFAPNGGAIWRLRTSAPLRSQPAYHDGVLYVTLPERGLSAVNPGDGKVVWSTDKAPGVVVAERKGALVVWEQQSQTLRTVEKTTGDVLDSASLPGVVRLVPQGPTDAPIFALSRWGVIAKLSPRN
jgi:hypothetical protein